MTATFNASSIIKANELPPQEIQLWDSFLSHNKNLSSAFYSYSFVQAAFQAGKNVYIARLKHNHEVLAFFPFQFANKTMKKLGIAERVGGELNDYFGVISKKPISITPQELLKFCNLNYFNVSHLEEHQLEFGLEASNPIASPIVDFAISDDALNSKQRRKKKHFIKETERRKNKAIEDLGTINFTFINNNIDKELDTLIRHKQNQYQSTNSKDPLKNSQERLILKKLAHTQEKHCKGILSTLYAGDTWLASHLGLLSENTMHYWFPVYDPKYLEYSAGRLLIVNMMEHAKKQGLNTFDFGAGSSQMKSKFANDSFTVYKGVWRNQSLAALSYQSILSAKWKINSLTRKLSGKEK